MSSSTTTGRLRWRVAVFVCVAAVAVSVDQLSKLWALSSLSDGRSLTVVDGVLSFTLVRNPGASLGFGSGFTWVFSLLAVVVCIVLVVLAARTTSYAWVLAMAVAFAGAFGNLVDRVAYADGFLDGKVVDFIDYGWSVGNVADIYLVVVGVAIVLMLVFDVPFGSGRECVNGEFEGEQHGEYEVEQQGEGVQSVEQAGEQA